jgi:hypothetical protein
MAHSILPPEWNGEERRARLNDKSEEALWNLLREIKTSLDTHLAQEAVYQPKVIELIEVLDKSKGVITLIKVLVYLCAPLFALWAWAKDHVKL